MTIILGIESTAHTFGIGIVKNGKVLANVRDMYTTESGGIIPTESAKHHEKIKQELYKKALEESQIKEKEIDAIAISQGPGLAPCLLVGMKFAKELSKKLNKPIILVNHCVAHLEIGKVTGAKDPVLLYTSGANTQIIAYASGKYRIFGETLDLGVGNFIDTFGRYAGLGFPAGPKIQELARQGKDSDKVILLHGYGPKCGFDKMSLPWLKKELEKKGYVVNTPHMPNRDSPKFNDWVEFLIKNNNFDSNTIVSCESFSGLVMLRILEKLNKPIKKLVMSGCFCEPIRKDLPFNQDLDWKFNFDRIRKNVQDIIVLADETDDTVPFERTKSLADKLGVSIRKVIANKPHFRGDEEPEKLKAILEGENRKYIELPYKVKGMDIALSGILTNLRQKLEKIKLNENLSSQNSEIKKVVNVQKFSKQCSTNKNSKNYFDNRISAKHPSEAGCGAINSREASENLGGAGGNDNYSLEDLCFSLQETVFAMLVETAERALAHTGKKELLLGGGVACNSRLQEMCKIMCAERGAKFFCPERSLLVDNAAMIAFLGEIMFDSETKSQVSSSKCQERNAGIKVSLKELEDLDIMPRQRTDDVDVKWK